MLQTLQNNNTEGVLDALATGGACIVANMLDPQFCDELMLDFQPYLEAQTWGIDELGYRNNFYGSQTKRLHGLFSKSKRMVDVLLHPLTGKIARAMFVDSGRANDIRLSNAELMVLGENQAVQEFHRDEDSWYKMPSRSEEILVSVNLALTDFTQTNGATRVVPGSHQWDKVREPEPEEIVQAIMPKGSGLLYTGKAVHAGGENQTNVQRTGLYLGYIVSWLRPIENQLVTNIPEDIFSLSESAQQLLDVSKGGFTVFA